MTDYVVITGASSGIGRALTILLASSGYKVVATGSNEIELNRTKLLAWPSEKNITTLVADLSKVAGVDKIAGHFKPGDKIRYLIHSAATTDPHEPLTKLSPLEFDMAMNINVKAPIFLTQKLRDYFDISMTRVLFMGSDYVGMDSKSRPEITASYAITKSALASAVKYLRQEEHKASIGYFNPGSTNTPMLHSIKHTILKRGGLFSLPRLAEPKEIAQSILALLENTSNQVYSENNWDYRKSEHQLLIQSTPEQIRAAL